MEPKISLLLLRRNLEENLQDWMPENDNLINKELALFDRLVTRRDFLKSTSLAALSVLISGCGSEGGPPSQWSEFEDEPTLVGIEDMSTVTTPANIVVDSDVLTSAVSHSPLGAHGSDDAPHVKDNAILESFNPHIMTADTYDFGEKSGFIQPDSTYGIPEYVHLSKDSGESDYYLDIYEKSNDGHHGLKETKVPLDGTSSLTFNTLTAVNGSLHNKVSGSTAYSQKMAMLANVGPSIPYDDSTSIPLRLYYQTDSNALLEPGVEPTLSFNWKHIDLMTRFKADETHAFSSYEVVEADAYHDGANQKFIYGTIRFDSLYSYGFIVAFNAFSDTEPSVTFFAPEFLSHKADTVQNLVDGFASAVPYTHDSLESFAIFAKQTFRPLTQMVDTEGKTASQVIFSFVSYDIAAGSTYSRVHPQGIYFNLDRFFALDKDFIKRYIMTVETSQGGVVYGLGGYKPSASITADADTFTLVFDTASIPSVDIWHDVYSQNRYQLEHTFVRSLKRDANGLNILMATSFYDQTDLGVSQKSIELDIDQTSGALSNLTVHTADTLFEASTHEGQGYQALWFDEMKGHLYADTLADCVLHDNGILDFYCTHNHQGLLRSYYIVRYVHPTDGSVNSFLIGYNEQGTIPQNETGDATMAYQNHDTLKEQIINNTALHHPPMPVAVNPRVMHPWHGVANDGEVLYTATRQHIIDTANRRLIDNDGSQGNLFSYAHASCDIVEKSWNMFEEQKQVASDKAADHMLSIDLHQIHLHATNIYGMNAQLDDDTYVEIRFNKKLVVKDYTDVGNPKTYHIGPLSSIFVKPDASSRISLEIDAGNNDDKYNGAMLEYRFISKQALKLKPDRPVADLVNTDGITTEFKQCNISFRMYDRLSTDQFGKVRTGAPKDIGTAKDALSSSVKSEYQEAVPKFAEGYTTLHAGAKPDNGAPMRSIRHTHEAALLPDGTVALVANTTAGARASALFFHFHIHFKPISWIRHAIKTIVKVVKHIVTEAEKALQKAAEAIKKAVTQLAEDIDAVIEAIKTTIANAAQDIAAAVEKAWDAVTTFAEELWDFLKALFDLNNGWLIGQQLKQLYYDQLKPLDDPKSKNTQPHNAYTFLQDAETAIGHEIDTIAQKTKEGIDDAIDNIFGHNDAFNTHHKQGRKDYNNSKENSTSTNWLLEQFNRILSSFPLEGLTGCTLDPSGSSTLSLILDTGEQIGKQTFDQINDITKEVEETITQLANGASMSAIEGDLKPILKDSVNVAIDDIDTLLNGVVKLPTAILSDEMLSSCLKSPLGAVERPILELVGLLIFLDKDKFKDLEDLAYFSFGFGVNIIEFVMGTALKDLDTHNIDLIEHITSGKYRTTVNEMGGYMTLSTNSVASRPDDAELEWLIAMLVSDSLAELAIFIQSVVTALGYFKLKIGFTNRISAFMFTVQAGCKIPGIAKATHDYVYTEGTKGLIPLASMFSGISIMGSFLLQFVARLAAKESGSVSTYDPYLIVSLSMAVATVLRFISAILQATYYTLKLIFDDKYREDIPIVVLDGVSLLLSSIRGIMKFPLNATNYYYNVTPPPKTKEELIAYAAFVVFDSFDVLENNANAVVHIAKDIIKIVEVTDKEATS